MARPTVSRYPATETGRGWHWRLHAPMRGCVEPCGHKMAILAIEQEAREQAERFDATVEAIASAAIRADLAARIEERFTSAALAYGWSKDTLAAVLAIVREEAAR